MKAEFDDIRAYQDQEVNEVLLSLLNDAEFIQFFSRQKFPLLHRIFPFLIQKRVHGAMHAQFKELHDVQAWQKKLTPFVDALMKKTVSEFHITGLEHLDKNKAYLFICNHRDIAMDPLLVNVALLSEGFATSKIAIGDNLLKRSFVEKLMRLNKSFVVKRSFAGRKEKLDGAKQLSAYIHESLKSDQHVWLAQKEGRAKDGLDFTDTAVLKMLHLAGRKLGWEFKESLNFLNIVPVSISYEWDPCDEDKAKELVAYAQQGHYEKSHDEDFSSIIRGLQGNKGQVTVHFSQALSLDSNVADDWSRKIDESIHQHYHLYDNNHLAHDLLKGDDVTNRADYKIWQKKYSHLNEALYNRIVKTYAQPVILQNLAIKNDTEK